jgi:hypothetical protein
MSVALVPRLQNILKAIFPIVIFFYTTLQTGMTGISLQGAMASDFSFVCQFFFIRNNCFFVTDPTPRPLKAIYFLVEQ